MTHRPTPPANCAAVRGALSALVDERLTPRARGRLEDHLRGCPACLAEVRAQLELARRVRALPRRSQPSVAELAARVRAVHRAGRRPTGSDVATVPAAARRAARHAASRRTATHTPAAPSSPPADRTALWVTLAALLFLVTAIAAYEAGHADGWAAATSIPDTAPATPETERQPAPPQPDASPTAEPRTAEPITPDRDPPQDAPPALPPLRPQRPVDPGPTPAELTGGR